VPAANASWLARIALAKQWQTKRIAQLERLCIEQNSEALYKWAVEKSGLATPVGELEQKHGRGIFRRFFYWIPSKGVGAVDRLRLRKYKCDGTARLHEFADIGVPGTVSSRRASCHMCKACWANNRRACENLEYTGIPTELTITREALPVTSLSRVTRSALDAESITRGQGAAVGSVVCVETHNSEQTTPWVIGEVVSAAHTAPADSVPYDSANDAVHYEPVRVGESVLSVMLYEPLAPGSTTYSLSDVELLVPARRVRVVGVQLLALRSNHFKRFAIEAVSLQAIRAEMPTSDDTWTVEAVVQYRTYYRQERWLVKWVGYGEDRNTWEPIENLTAEWVQGEAERVKKDFLAEKAAKECAAARGGPRRAAAQ